MNNDHEIPAGEPDSASSSRETIERTVRELVDAGALDEALKARLAVLDIRIDFGNPYLPREKGAIERYRRQVTRLATALRVSRLSSDPGASR